CAPRRKGDPARRVARRLSTGNGGAISISRSRAGLTLERSASTNAMDSCTVPFIFQLPAINGCLLLIFLTLRAVFVARQTLGAYRMSALRVKVTRGADDPEHCWRCPDEAR